MDEATTATWTAYAALLAWPVVALFIYQAMPFPFATAWTFLGALLLLPAQVAIKIPMVPAIDKNTIASLSAVLGCLIFRSNFKRPRLRFGLVGALAAIYICGPIFTSALNNDNIVFDNVVLPGVGYYDGVSAMLSQAIVFIPFFLGRLFFRNTSGNEAILQTLLFGGCLFTIPMLIEIRMSPQLATWIYGYFPSSFLVESRYGGYRPVVFMTNGLIAAFFLSTSLLAAVALQRAGPSTKVQRSKWLVPYLGLVIVLCKSAGALIYAATIGAVMRWIAPKNQVQIAVLLVSLALIYPVLRVINYFPTDQLVQLSMTFNQERAESLKFRFDQEQTLLSHASERFFFGWGRYGRNRVYEGSGKDVSVTDGLWIVTLGTFGFVGFVAQFGLLTLPVYRVYRAFRFIRSAREARLLAGLALIVAVTAIEQLPNASMAAWSWLLAGALLGRGEQLNALAKRAVAPNPRAGWDLQLKESKGS